MDELPQVLVELRQLQGLYELLASRPALLQGLESRGLLARVAPNDTRLQPPALAFELGEFLHAHGEHHISARLAALADPSAGDGLHYFARSCASLREALASLMQHQADWLPGGQFQLREDADTLELRILPHAPSPPLGQLLFWEGTLIWLHRALQQCVDQPVAASAVAVMTPATPQAAVLERLLGCPVQFGAGHFSLCWPARWLDHPLPGSHPVVRARLAGCFDSIARRRQMPVPLWHHVLDALETAPSPAELGMVPVAARLGLTPITLRRRLASEGRQFTALLAAFQRERAFDLAVVQGHCEASVAERLGYAGRVPLGRAFRGWYGTTPDRLRQTLVALQGLGAGQDWASPLHLPAWPGLPSHGADTAQDPAQDPVLDPVPWTHALGEAGRAWRGATTLVTTSAMPPARSAPDAQRLQHLALARRWLQGRPSAGAPRPPAARAALPANPLPAGSLLPASRHLGALLLWRTVGLDASGPQGPRGAAPLLSPDSCAHDRRRFGVDRQALSHLLLAAWSLPPDCLQVLGRSADAPAP